MQTFHDSWAASKHNTVTCIKCHFEPGVAGTLRGKFQGLFQVFSYATSFYKKSKPWAEVSDATCEQSGCHVNQDQNKQIGFKNVMFSHANHLKDIRRVAKLRCTSCHSQMVQGEHLMVTPGTCFTCHFKAGTETRFAQDSLAACQRCHTTNLIERKTNPNVRYDHQIVVDSKLDCKSCHGDVVQGTGDVPRQACMTCHFEREKLAKYDDVRFVHTNHVTDHKIECQNCHILIQHKVQKLNPTSPPDCNSCHPGTHMEQKVLFSGHGGNTRLDEPSKMYTSGLDCRGCHVLHGLVDGKNVTRANGHACETCHGPGFDKILETWKEYSATKLTEIEGIYKHAASTVHGAHPAQQELHAAAEQLLSKAEENINIVRVGKGLHNMTYATSLLSSANDLMHAALDTLHSAAKLPVFSLAKQSVTPSECSSCHQRMEDYKPVPAFGVDFKHSAHIVNQKMTCDNCHTNQPKHGTLWINKQSCTSCHHKEPPVADNNCRTCHTTQAMMYDGKIAGMGADAMKEADVKCVDCHANTEMKITRAVGPKCASCHDSKYPPMMETYRNDVAKLSSELKGLIESTGGTDAARSLLSIIAKDGSNGAHNIVGISEQLQKAIKDIKARKTSALVVPKKSKRG